ncbi:MAG: 50S ribosomal protein L10 [Oligoflexales bacterium]|nr:50S ribosomal protein L10 [Oligoflexales bacterium]
MAKLRAAKGPLGDKLATCFNKATATLVAEYKGMSANDLATLRKELRGIQGEFRVVKNRIAIKAILNQSEKSGALVDRLKGPIGVTYMYGDVAAGAKLLFSYSQTNQNLVIKGGLLDGRLYSASDFEAISQMPPREVFIARILGSIVAPHKRLMGVLQGVSTNLVRVLQAVKDKKSDAS